MRPRLEICVDTWHDAQVAAQSGADRIELCAALDQGGLTPSFALMELAAGLPVPVYAMIRPRGGNFAYSADEISTMEQEIAQARKASLAGVVFGAETNGALDVPVLARLSAQAQEMGRTLHRVVDILDDPVAAVAPAISLGFERILTSGGARRAIDGADVIAQMARQARGRISIMPGAGVGPDNAQELLRIPGIVELHGSFSAKGADGKNRTDASVARSMRRLLDTYPL